QLANHWGGLFPSFVFIRGSSGGGGHRVVSPLVGNTRSRESSSTAGRLDHHVPLLRSGRTSSSFTRATGTRYAHSAHDDADGEWLGGINRCLVHPFNPCGITAARRGWCGMAHLERRRMTAIEFDMVSKRYQQRSVLSNLSFRIEPGERVVI